MKYIKYMWKKNIEPKIFDKKKCFQSQLNFIIESNKQKYFEDVFEWWNIPCIPHLSYQNINVTDFFKKAEYSAPCSDKELEQTSLDIYCLVVMIFQS